MRFSTRVFVCASLVLGVGLLASGDALAFGALAIQSGHRSAYGWSHDYDSKAAAEEEALMECGPGCKVVLDFWNGCGSYAVDQTRGSTVYGWSTGKSRGEAEDGALSQCEAHGGDACVVKVWACE